jgi:hypothetical protein
MWGERREVDRGREEGNAKYAGYYEKRAANLARAVLQDASVWEETGGVRGIQPWWVMLEAVLADTPCADNVVAGNPHSPCL